MSFNDKVVLVTGASSGIGAAIALKFSQEGAKVAIVGRNEGRLNNIADKCEKAGTKPLVIIADVSKDDDAERTVKKTISHFKRLDILINNAGIGSFKSILDEQTMQEFDQTMATNLRACVYLTYLSSNHLIESKGNIINISSVASLPTSGSVNYAYGTSKAALDHFTRAIASELATKGVRANTINPGPVETDVLVNLGKGAEFQAKQHEMMAKATALKRISKPEEIADLVLFLASDKAIAITGASFVTDNGYLLNVK